MDRFNETNPVYKKMKDDYRKSLNNQSNWEKLRKESIKSHQEWRDRNILEHNKKVLENWRIA